MQSGFPDADEPAEPEQHALLVLGHHVHCLRQDEQRDHQEHAGQDDPRGHGFSFRIASRLWFHGPPLGHRRKGSKVTVPGTVSDAQRGPGRYSEACIPPWVCRAYVEGVSG